VKAAPTSGRIAGKSKDTAKRPLYEALPYTLLRAPLLPVEQYLNLISHDAQNALLSDVKVRAALAIGSTSLLSAIDRFQAGTLSKRDAERMRSKLRRYLIRMSTRPTPYGLFAGVALVPFETETTLKVNSVPLRSSTRPDMGWLFDLVLSAEEKPEIRNQLSWVANTSAYEKAGRLFLLERAASKHGRAGTPVSIRATGVVRRAMALARTPIPYRQLALELMRNTPGATGEKVEKLLTDLYEQTFLLTDLRPPLTAGNPSDYVRKKLTGIDAANEISGKLNRLLDAISIWDETGGDEKIQKFWGVVEAAEVPSDGSKQVPVQADLSLPVSGALGEIVAKEAAEAAELLLRLSSSPGGLSVLAAYRQSFVQRYGHHREVPLLELLDPQTGLGPLGSRGHANVGPTPAKAAERARALTDLACACLRRNQRVVELDDELVRRLETSEPSAQAAPVSLDVNLQIGARSATELDRGNFIVVIGPNLGAQAAGRNLGRFAELVGPDSQRLLQQIATAESQHRKEEIEAEIVYLPYNHRIANVVIRPSVRTHEVPVGVSSGVNWENAIALNELTVGIDENRFYVRWLPKDQRVRFTAGHMLTHYNAPPAIRFLSEVSSDGRMMFTSFDWGPVENFPFLPRAQRGRIVLRPAQWTIYRGAFLPDSPDAFQHWLANWRDEWDVPRHVCLSSGDNRLILDLDQTVEAEELRAELRKIREGGSVVVQEVLPHLDDAWLTGAEGHYFNEVVVSLVLRPPTEPVPVKQAAERVASRNGFQSALSRNRPPGSEWLFVKLYCPRQFEEDVISGAVLDFAEDVTATGVADSWFYIRYSDPERHIRLRLHGTPRRLAAELFPRLSEWAGSWMEQGVFSKFVFDTYEQELERFGGIERMKAAEALFAADSRSSAKLLRCFKKNTWPHDETTFLVLSIDDLLTSIGLTEEERTAWYGKQINARGREIGDAYRKRKDNLRRAVGSATAFLSEFDFGSEVIDVLAERHDAMAAVGRQLRELPEDQAISRPMDDLCSSFVHLHLNRLASGDALPEHQILGLLQRTRESLRNAPIKK